MEVDMKIDLVSEEKIGLLVDHFYAKVRVDPVLGPIFERVVRGEWGAHLETMRNFWSSVMLTSGRYKGAPVPAHLRVKGIEPQMFDRWLRLFGETCDDLFEKRGCRGLSHEGRSHRREPEARVVFPSEPRISGAPEPGVGSSPLPSITGCDSRSR
jgi:hemoglobin